MGRLWVKGFFVPTEVRGYRVEIGGGGTRDRLASWENHTRDTGRNDTG